MDKLDFAECASLLAHILLAKTKSNSEQYFKDKIHTILSILNTFFNQNDIDKYESEDIELYTVYIEKKINEAVEAFKKEDLNESVEQ